MITCYLRYFITPGKQSDFEEYGRRWTKLIEKFGGKHLGYFIEDEAPNLQSAKHFSFPGLGKQGPSNVGIALYSFPHLEAFNAYRKLAAEDPECREVTAHFNTTQCFTGYERNFVRRID